MDIPRSIYDPTGELYQSLTPSPIFSNRAKGLVLLGLWVAMLLLVVLTKDVAIAGSVVQAGITWLAYAGWLATSGAMAYSNRPLRRLSWTMTMLLVAMGIAGARINPPALAEQISLNQLAALLLLAIATAFFLVHALTESMRYEDAKLSL